MATARVRVNHQIRAPELRVIGPHGENVGVIVLQEALSKASQLGLDLIEISPNAIPPVAKIMDYGKFQ
ncbi:MAG TPA: translation initiation factor IF-3, partial [Candidatus Taylorbacteria bacterium]|nr:translation initiation factor IF-3 [Candidatus Taylorbacteria bacterium]